MRATVAAHGESNAEQWTKLYLNIATWLDMTVIVDATLSSQNASRVPAPRRGCSRRYKVPDNQKIQQTSAAPSLDMTW